jgi:hypothetical protein
MFRYAKCGATQLEKALINAAAAPDAQAITSTIQTAYGAAAGSKKFEVLQTTGNAWTDHALRGGWLLVDDGGTAMGDMYRIKDNYWTMRTVFATLLRLPMMWYCSRTSVPIPLSVRRIRFHLWLVCRLL